MNVQKRLRNVSLHLVDVNFPARTKIRMRNFKGDREKMIKQVKMVRQEVEIMKQLGDHPRIVKYLQTDVLPDKSGVAIILELQNGGCIRSLLDLKGKLSDREASLYMKQILEGLQYMHGKNIVHRDLKCSNVLLSSTSQAKLGDFGTAK